MPDPICGCTEDPPCFSGLCAGDLADQTFDIHPDSRGGEVDTALRAIHVWWVVPRRSRGVGT
jgi:hypothetical protein